MWYVPKCGKKKGGINAFGNPLPHTYLIRINFAGRTLKKKMVVRNTG